MSERYPRPFTNSGGNRGPYRTTVDSGAAIDPTPADAGVPRNQIHDRSGGHRAVNRPNIRNPWSYMFERCDNRLAVPEVIYLPFDLFRLTNQLAAGGVYKILDNGGDVYGCFRFIKPFRGAWQELRNVQFNGAAQCSDCDVDHGSVITVTDCDGVILTLAEPNNLHGVSFQVGDIIEVTIGDSPNSECVIVGQKTQRGAGDPEGFGYTFTRVIGDSTEDCTACANINGYTIEKCDEIGVTYFVEDVAGEFNANWVNQIHEFNPAVGDNFCAKILADASGWLIDITNSTSFTAIDAQRVQFRGAACTSCDDIPGFVITPCDAAKPKYFIPDTNGEGNAIVGNIYYFTITGEADPLCYEISRTESLQDTEIEASNEFLDGTNVVTARGALKADCASCVPVYGCTDSNASNYDPTATHDDGSCTYPPQNPLKLWAWSADLGGQFSTTSNNAGQDAKIIHGCTDVWAEDPNDFFLADIADQDVDPWHGFYVIRKGAGATAEYKLGLRGACVPPSYGFGADMTIGLGINDPEPATSAEIDWTIVSAPYATLEEATSKLLSFTQSSNIGACKVRVSKRMFHSLQTGPCGNDGFCYTKYHQTFHECLMVTPQNHPCGYGSSYDWDARAIYIARTSGNVAVGDVVTIAFAGNDPIIAEVIETGLKAEQYVAGNNAVYITTVEANHGQAPNLDTVLDGIEGAGYAASRPQCFPNYKYYKAEVCGVENTFVYISMAEYITDSNGTYGLNPDYPLTIGDFIAFNSPHVTGEGCAEVISEVTLDTFYDSSILNRGTLASTGYMDCDDCLTGGGGEGGGGGGTTNYYEATDCADPPTSIELHDSNSNGPFSVGDMVVADDNGTYFCVTITAINIDPEVTPTIEAYTTAGNNCLECQEIIGGAP